ncbi:MAG: hypothetical protein H8F28_21260 [Fibrella sp.]|nr:hypothetical protein [Armatimonadota bacterium]
MEESSRNTNPEPEIPPTMPSLTGGNDSPNVPPSDAPVYAPSPVSTSEFNETDARIVAVQALREKASSSVGIMYAVMAFSILNSALISFGSPLVMAFGLATTDVISALTKDSGNYVHLLWNLIPLGFYLGLTTLAKKHWGWLIFLMLCYACDGLISLVDQRWISLAVHVYVLYLLWQGLSAAFAAQKLERMPTGYAG